MKSYEKAKAERAAEIADAKALIEGRIRLRQAGVKRNIPGRRVPPRNPSKKAVRMTIKFLAPALLALVVVGATAAAGSGDYALVLPTERVCAKSLETCEAAQRAIARGWLNWVAPDTPTRCEHAPSCFGARSNCIPGYIGPRAEGYCR